MSGDWTVPRWVKVATWVTLPAAAFAAFNAIEAAKAGLLFLAGYWTFTGAVAMAAYVLGQSLLLGNPLLDDTDGETV